MSPTIHINAISLRFDQFRFIKVVTYFDYDVN